MLSVRRTFLYVGLCVSATTMMLMISTSALATPVSYAFTGTVTFQNGDFAGQGSVVTGTIQLDDGLVDGNASQSVAQYNAALAANVPLASSFGYSITVGAVTKTGSGAIGTTSFLQMFDDLATDSVTFQVGAAPSAYLLLRALNGSGSDLTLPPAPGGFNPISDALAILNGLDPSQFASAPSLWAEGSTNQVQFTWDSITLVPEPSTALLLGMGLLGLGVGRGGRD